MKISCWIRSRAVSVLWGEAVSMEKNIRHMLMGLPESMAISFPEPSMENGPESVQPAFYIYISSAILIGLKVNISAQNENPEFGDINKVKHIQRI